MPTKLTRKEFLDGIQKNIKMTGRAITSMDIKEMTFLDDSLADLEADHVLFRECDFTDTKLEKIKLHKCRFEQCEFSRAQFEQTWLNSCQFVDCGMSEVVFSKCHVITTSFLKTCARKATFQDSVMQMSIWEQCNLLEFHNQNSPLLLTGMRNCGLQGASFANSNIPGGTFKDSDLTGANFSMANLILCSFNGANLKDTNFTGARCIGISVIDIQADETVFKQADCHGIIEQPLETLEESAEKTDG